MGGPTRGDFTLDDFRKQIGQLRQMGPMHNLLDSLPGMKTMLGPGEDPDEALARVERMIDAMTDEERRDPDRIDSARLPRIAADSGTTPDEVEQFLGQFRQMRELMRQMAQMSVWERLKHITGLGGPGKPMPGNPDGKNGG